MTWVISKPFVQGYTITVADTCVSYKTNKTDDWQYDDCLMKLYALNQRYNLLVGFAGDVRNAFKVVENMSIHCEEYAYQHPDEDLDVDTFVRSWRAIAIESGNFDFQGEGAVEISVAGTKAYDGNNPEVTGFSSIAILKSPEYRPMMVHPFQWHAIGSGSSVGVCKEIIDVLSNDFRGRVMALNRTGEEFASIILPNITQLLSERLLAKGISKEVLTVGITQYKSTNFGFIYKDFDQNGNPILPKLCGNYVQLQNHLERKNVNSATAILQAKR